MEEVVVSEMNIAQVSEVAAIHMQTLPDDLLPSFGLRFLENSYYKEIAKCPFSKVFVAICNKEVVGFVNISYMPEKLSRYILGKSFFAILFSLLKLLFVDFERVKEFISVALADGFHTEGVGEVSFIAVHPNFHGKGIAPLLVKRANESLYEQGVKRCFTKTLKRNLHVFSLYKKNFGAEIVKELKVYKKEYVFILWQTK